MWMKGRREVVWGRKEEGDFVIKSRQTECSLVYLWRYWLGPFYLSGPAGLLRYPPDLFSNFKYCHFFFIFRRIVLAVQYCVVFRIQRLWRKEKEKKKNYDLFSFPAPAHPSVFVGPSSISFMPTGWLPQHAHGWFQLFEKSFSFLSFFFFFLGDFSLFLFVSSPSSLVDFFCFSYADKFSTFLISLSFTINKRHIPHREFLFLSIPFHNSIEISLISRDCGL